MYGLLWMSAAKQLGENSLCEGVLHYVASVADVAAGAYGSITSIFHVLEAVYDQ